MAEAAKKPESEAPKRAEDSNARTGAATVVVGCRIPFGLVLQTYVMVDASESVMNGPGRDFKIARKTPHRYVLNGNRVRVGQDRRWEIQNGAGLTAGIPADVWDKWYEDNKNEPIVKNKLVFAHARQVEVVAMAKDAKQIRTGLEPFNPDGSDPRKPKPPAGDRVIGELQKGNADTDD
jgi:hypothetical protein